MNMNRTIRHSLSVLALPALLALGMTGCAGDDDTFGRQPEGSILLELGDITVAGMHTRAAIAEDPATGYTGIRKTF
jgi:hypothetical protein